MNPPDRLAQSDRTSERPGLSPGWCKILGGAVISFAAAIFAAAASTQPFVVTQKGRAFNPGALRVREGDSVEIVNDDGELIHHAYVAAPSFSFDSGDQEPGSKTDVVFSVKGRFTVLCGIHPKMHLTVDVQ